MTLQIHHEGLLLGSIIRRCPGCVYAYAADGRLLGQFHDVDAACAALTNRINEASNAT
jgi:hypothetical protein